MRNVDAAALGADVAIADVLGAPGPPRTRDGAPPA